MVARTKKSVSARRPEFASTGRRTASFARRPTMAHVITSPCFGCKYTDCVVVCPVDAFREGEQMLYIDPETCIDCGMCEPECPVSAIFYEDDVPGADRPFIE